MERFAPVSDGRRTPGLGLERAAVVVLGLYLTGTAAHALRSGRWFYTDYLGLRMPVLVALAAGLALLLAGTALWSRLGSFRRPPRNSEPSVVHDPDAKLR